MSSHRACITILMLLAFASVATVVVARKLEPMSSYQGYDVGHGFALSIGPRRAEITAHDTLEIGIGFAGVSSGTVLGRVRIRVPDGLGLVSGDTAYTDTVDQERPPRRLRLRALRSGSFDLRATLEIGDFKERGELCEVSLPITVENGVVRTEYASVTRDETVRAGRRFRFADPFFVPMDSTERFDMVEFRRRGTPAAPRGGPDGRCATCDLAAADTVTFAAVIDQRGRVIQAQNWGRRDWRKQSPEVIAAARAALAEWRFRPARLAGRPVHDWCWVYVPVR